MELRPERPAPRRAGAVAAPQQEAQPLEVDARHGRGDLRAGQVPEQEGALGVREEAHGRRSAAQTTTFVFEPDRYTGKTNQVVVPGREGRRRSATPTVVGGEGRRKGFAFASATWHFSTEKLPEGGARRLLHGLAPLLPARDDRAARSCCSRSPEGAALAVGDELEVQLSLRTKHAAEYVHLRDPRARRASSPRTPCRATSGTWASPGTRRRATRGTNFFFEWLPAGEYTFKYRVRANMAGTFRVGPATVQSMYAPEFTAYSAGGGADDPLTRPRRAASEPTSSSSGSRPRSGTSASRGPAAPRRRRRGSWGR